MAILVVDDNKDTTDLIKLILTTKGYDVHVANSGKEGLELLRKNDIDLMILDMAMPDMNGLDVLEAISKEKELIPMEKIMIFTASPQFTATDIDKLSKKYGVSKEKIPKPFKKDELLEIVAKNLS